MRLFPVLLALTASGALLQAQEKPVRFGLHLVGVSSQGDLRDSGVGKNGWGAGIHVVFQASQGVQVRPHLTQLVFSDGQESQTYTSGGITYHDSQTHQLEALQIGVDLLLFPTGRTMGGYGLVGLSQDSWKYTNPYRLETVDGPQAGLVVSGSRARSGLHAGFALGAGWRFTSSWSAELRYEFSHFGDLSESMDTLRLQAGYRF